MIIGYCGLPGSGKTYTLAKDCAFAMRKNKPVYANFALRGAKYFNDITQVLNVERGIIAIDELNTICPASKWQSLPIEYINLWTQSRKNSIDLLFTTQNFKRVVSSIRDVTNYVWLFGWVFSPTFISKWHTARKFDAFDVERERMRAKPIKKYRFYEKKKIYNLYDTSFRIKVPEHLRKDTEFDLTFEHERLPTFNDDLILLENL